MSEKMNYKVYVHIAPNGKRYYGITKQEVEKRWNNGKGYSNNDHFTNAINYYDWDNFEHIVIARGLTEEEDKWIEVELIREWDTTNREYGYNITKGGDSNPMDNEESRRKLSETMTGENNPNYGKTFIEETRKKMSENSPRTTKVYCVELDMVFNTVTEASKFVGCSKGNISGVLIGRQKTAKGYHWIYAEDKDKLTS